jgi:DnaJ-class molecular chaperone
MSARKERHKKMFESYNLKIPCSVVMTCQSSFRDNDAPWILVHETVFFVPQKEKEFQLNDNKERPRERKRETMRRSRISLAGVLLLRWISVRRGAAVAASPFFERNPHYHTSSSTSSHQNSNNKNNNKKTTFNDISKSSNDPYKVLGVSPDATQDEIRRAYRKLCLRFHPDKNVHLASDTMRRDCEDTFKRIQRANSQIGDAESRRQFDTQARMSSIFSGDGHDHYNQDVGGASQASRSTNPANVYEDLFSELFGFPTSTTTTGPRRRPYRSSSFSYGFSSPFGFSVNGAGGGRPSPFFSSPDSAYSPAESRTSPVSSSPLSSSPFSKATFVQTVPVSLEDLYRGVSRLPVQVQVSSLWSRVAAAFRGGIAYTLLYQSLLCALPFVRMSRLVALAIGIYLFCIHLPQPVHDPRYYSIDDNEQQASSSSSSSSVLYHINLQPGYKGGTKLVFESSTSGPTVEIVLILQEKKHDLYQRVGNDLHAYLHISSRQAKRGGVISIPNLKAPPPSATTTKSTRRSSLRRNDSDDGDDNSCFTLVTIPPRTQKGDVITVAGQGWFNRKTRQYGDLIVHIQGTYNNNSGSSKKMNHQ